jgi:hypothetical protein
LSKRVLVFLNKKSDRNGTVYDTSVAKAAPEIPYMGIKMILSATLVIIPKKVASVIFFVMFSATKICCMNELSDAPTVLQAQI